MFLISLVHHYHPALFHRHALILDRLLTFLTAFSTLVLKLFFAQSLFLHSILNTVFFVFIDCSIQLLNLSNAAYVCCVLIKASYLLTYLLMYPLLRFISWNLITRCLAVTGGGSVSECGRLSGRLSRFTGQVRVA